MKRQAMARMPLPWGNFSMYAYADQTDDPMPHLALVAEGFDPQKAVPVRIHSECMTGDVFGSRRCDCGEQLRAALQIAGEQGGVVIYLRQEGRGIGLINKLKAYNLQDAGLNTIEANTHLGFDADARQYEAAIYILDDLKITEVQLITNNPAKVDALKQAVVKVSGRIPVVIPPHTENKAYLQTKQDLMGHLLGM
jgi:GTP cyclohydrolase II